MALYKIGNYPMVTTAGPVPVDTTASLLTLLQIKASTTKPFKIKEWGVSHDGSAAAEPGVYELIEVDVAATVTAHAATGIQKYDAEALLGGDPTTNLVPVGTTSTGFTATVENTVTASRMLDPQLIAPTGQFVREFSLGVEPQIQVAKFLRIRVKFAVAVNALCYVVIEV